MMPTKEQPTRHLLRFHNLIHHSSIQCRIDGHDKQCRRQDLLFEGTAMAAIAGAVAGTVEGLVEFFCVEFYKAFFFIV
jgi:hypothetical protein